MTKFIPIVTVLRKTRSTIFFVRSGQYPEPPILDAAMTEAKHYYNGYEINGLTLYNPWSIVSYVKHGQARPYWVNTGNDALINRYIIEGGNIVI
ncbi:MAG: hypothetical protein LRY67_01160 [Gammaproteobacteria bacterium]|nr:hypothetical protein [Gammaproteobacteria bacterium]